MFKSKQKLTQGLCCLLIVVCESVSAESINLTRLLATITPAQSPELLEFAANPGKGQITIDAEHSGNVSIRLNGSPVVSGTVELLATNTLDISTKTTSRIRVTQAADVELSVQSRIHFNTNVRDFVKSRSFYGNLGFETLSGFPDTNTLAMAQAIGIETPTNYDGKQGAAAGGYLLHGELIGLGFSKGLIDLIEFTIPRNDQPPYAATNHIGLSRAVIHSRNLDWDYTNMRELGINFISEPATTSEGIRFAIFTDPDGTFYELREVGGETDPQAKSQFEELGAVVINVSDYQRSAAWYQMLGFELERKLPANESAAVGRGLGLSGPIQVNGAVLTHRVDGSQLEIIEWIKPRNQNLPYPVPVNHIGIHRMAFATTDMQADVAQLRAQGVEFVSEVTPCCSGPDSWGSIVAFYDPDGMVMELADQPLMSVMSWIMRLFD